MSSTRLRIVIVQPEGYAHAEAFAELAETLLEAFEALGSPAEISRNGFDPDGTNLVLGWHLLTAAQEAALPGACILYNLEQLDDRNGPLVGRLLQLADRCELWDYSRRNIDILHQAGLGTSVQHVPIGTMPGMTRIPAAERQDIDVLFYGSLNDRRRQVLEALKAEGIKVHAVFGLYGMARDRLIARSKVVLNLHYYDSSILELVRLSYLWSNRKAVVAECHEATEIPSGLERAARYAPYDGLVAACRELLADDAARHRLESEGHACMASRLESEILRRVLAGEAEISPVGTASVPPPLCSIIVPAFNQVELTKQCVDKLREGTPAGLYELILVDNGSTDETPAFLSGLQGRVLVITNAENRGFVDACNQGAAAAAGRYLVFLHNDTIPLPGWLEALVALAEQDATVGAAGAKLVHPDGRLQEAGGLVFSDGTAAGFGRFADPFAPPHTEEAEVDYCSGAALLVRREVFERLGGFDARYAPACYEDADLCFGLRKLGYQVRFCPDAVVLHVEGGTVGADRAIDFSRFQAVNQEKFRTKWKEELAKQDLPPHLTGEQPVSADRQRLKVPATHVLIVGPSLPAHDRDAGSLRMFRILLILRALKCEITYIARSGFHQERYHRQLEALGITVLAPDPEKLAQLGQFCQAPPIPLARILAERPCHLAWLCSSDVAEQYLPDIRKHAPGTTVVVDTAGVQFPGETRLAETEGDPDARARAARLRARELAIYAQADRVCTVTEADAAALRKAGLTVPTEVVPNIHIPAGETPGWASREGLVFVGNFDQVPNVDAVTWLCREIMPRVERQLPGIRLSILGPNPPPDVLALGGATTSVLGWVAEAAPCLDQARVSVAPMRTGTGMKGKVGEALARGLPTVTTTLGAEGLGLEPGRHAMIADDPESFAAAIVRLHQDEVLWERLSGNGRAIVEAQFGMETVGRRMLRLLRDLVQPQPEASRTSAAADTPRARLIAIHLPQFHPIPENDTWWGPGFTEWRNVAKAAPLFPGHHQPHLPEDLGFYDLRLPETRIAQAELARSHGIEGFCFWHYWFDGKLLLERPLLDLLETGAPDFPFCLAWANENWTRRWDGYEKEILQAQSYGGDPDDAAHFAWLLPFLKDRRAITIHGKPLFLIYRPGDLPQPERTLALWRRLAEEAGLPGLYLIAITTTFPGQTRAWSDVGFDGEMLFQPNFREFFEQAQVDMANRAVPQARQGAVVASYRNVWPRWARMSERTRFEPDLFASVVPGWDNSPRRARDPYVLTDSSPEAYAAWLRLEIERVQQRDPDRKIVFLNAWNEWAEGNHLEPDAKWKRGFLEATREAALHASAPPILPGRAEEPGPTVVKERYRSHQEVAEEVDRALQQDDLDRALMVLIRFVQKVQGAQGGDSLGEVDIALGHPALDRSCAAIGRKALAEAPRGGRSEWRPLSVYLASGLYKLGGHTRVLQDFIEADRSRSHRILMTGFFPDIEHAAIEQEFPGVQFDWAPAASPADKLRWLLRRIQALAPDRLFLFNHHEDAIAASAALPDLARNVYFVHHADHALSLGPFLPGVGHIDLTNTCHHVCASELGIESVYVPLSSRDHGINPTPRRSPGGALTTCCSASSVAKLQRVGYQFRYSDLFPWLYRQGVARHVHIGPLSKPVLWQISIRMDQAGIDRARFIHQPFEPVYWTALEKHGVDVALGSFPVGGGRTCVEAMGSGTPFVAHQNYLQRNLGGQDSVYPGGWTWQRFDELGDALADLAGPGLRTHAERARDHFEQIHSFRRLEEALADVNGRIRGIAPPPVRAFRRDALQATLDMLLRQSGS